LVVLIHEFMHVSISLLYVGFCFSVSSGAAEVLSEGSLCADAVTRSTVVRGFVRFASHCFIMCLEAGEGNDFI